MAENQQDYQMGNGEFGQGGEDYTQDDQMNGTGDGTGGENAGGDGAGENGTGDGSGKDDERYAILLIYYRIMYCSGICIVKKQILNRYRFFLNFV